MVLIFLVTLAQISTHAYFFMTKERNNYIFLIGIFLLFVLLIAGKFNHSGSRSTTVHTVSNDSSTIVLPFTIPIDLVKNTPH